MSCGSNEYTFAPGSLGFDVTVPPGEDVAGVDVTMLRGARMAGTLTNAATGAPAANACIWPVPLGDGGFPVYDSWKADAEGNYSIWVPPGRYTLLLGDCFGGGWVSEFYLDAVDCTDAVVLDLESGEEALGLDAALERGSGVPADNWSCPFVGQPPFASAPQRLEPDKRVRVPVILKSPVAGDVKLKGWVKTRGKRVQIEGRKVGIGDQAVQRVSVRLKSRRAERLVLKRLARGSKARAFVGATLSPSRGSDRRLRLAVKLR
jgi:hypothetical protein